MKQVGPRTAVPVSFAILCWPHQLRSVQGLESACETLEREYEGCEQVRLDVSGLESEKNLADSVAKELLAHKIHFNTHTHHLVLQHFGMFSWYLLRHLKKIDAQIRKTTGARLVHVLLKALLPCRGHRG